MKILKYTERGQMLVIDTDSLVLPQAVYFKDKFKSIDALIVELTKKEKEILNRKSVADQSFSVLTAELDSEVAKNEVKP